MILAALALTVAAASCTPDLAAYTATPVLTWDLPIDTRAIGVRLFWRYPGGTYAKLKDVPCWTEDEGARSCRGGKFGYPVQRASAVELQTIEVCAKTYDAAGLESATCSNAVSLCMPQVWHGGAYQ